MTDSINTELAQRIAAIAELKAGYKLGHADVAILQDVAREMDAARQRIADLEAEVKFPGVMRCNKCDFSRTHINAHANGMSAGESVPEHCPNGCGPMWHGTYRQQYNELYDSYKQLEARTEQKPVGYVHNSVRGDGKIFAEANRHYGLPVYLRAPAAQPVTVNLPDGRKGDDNGDPDGEFDYAWNAATEYRDQQWRTAMAKAGIKIAEGE